MTQRPRAPSAAAPRGGPNGRTGGRGRAGLPTSRQSKGHRLVKQRSARRRVRPEVRRERGSGRGMIITGTTQDGFPQLKVASPLTGALGRLGRRVATSAS